MLKRYFLSPWAAPIGLLLLCLASYATLITRLGYYWDDWTAVWYIHFLGPSSFFEAYSFDRPLLAWVASLTAWLFGESALNWQLYAVAARWLCSRPCRAPASCTAHRFQVTAVACLLFIRVSTSSTSLHLWKCFFIFSSIGFTAMLRRCRRPWFWSPGLSIARQLALFAAEYFDRSCSPALHSLVISDASHRKNADQAHDLDPPAVAQTTLYCRTWSLFDLPGSGLTHETPG
jgi:hypothetical protein